MCYLLSMLIAFQLQLEQKSMWNRIVRDTEKELAVPTYIFYGKDILPMLFVSSDHIFPGLMSPSSLKHWRM